MLGAKGTGGVWEACGTDYVCSKAFTNLADLVAEPKAHLADFNDVCVVVTAV